MELQVNGAPGSPASPGRFSGRGGVQPAGWDITIHYSCFQMQNGELNYSLVSANFLSFLDLFNRSSRGSFYFSVF